jgi:hypothetical protein
MEVEHLHGSLTTASGKHSQFPGKFLPLSIPGSFTFHAVSRLQFLAGLFQMRNMKIQVGFK